MSRFYDRAGNPIALDQWVNMVQEETHQRVALDEIADARVSTVWLGADHSFGDGPPLIFETMVFGGDHDGYQERYSTIEQAREGHKKTVAMVTAK